MSSSAASDTGATMPLCTLPQSPAVNPLTSSAPTTATGDEMQPPTTDYSSIRGKAVLVSPSEKQFELLRRRLQERIDDSRGETIFDLGIGDGE